VFLSVAEIRCGFKGSDNGIFHSSSLFLLMNSFYFEKTVTRMDDVIIAIGESEKECGTDPGASNVMAWHAPWQISDR